MEFKIEIKSLEYSIDKNKILEGIDLSIVAGELLVIMGPSGCGKTTLLRCIAGFENIDQGEIIISGKIMSDPKNRTAPHERGVGMIFQDLALWPHKTVFEHLRMIAKKNDEFILSILKKLKLDEFLKYYPAQLSGGQRQRLAIARALAGEPEILLMDEPFASLDWQLKQEAIDLIKSIRRESDLTVLYVTHDLIEASKIGDRFAIMKEGKFLQTDTLVNLIEKPANAFVGEFVAPSPSAKKNGSSPICVDKRCKAKGKRLKAQGRKRNPIFP